MAGSAARSLVRSAVWPADWWVAAAVWSLRGCFLAVGVARLGFLMHLAVLIDPRFGRARVYAVEFIGRPGLIARSGFVDGVQPPAGLRC